MKSIKIYQVVLIFIICLAACTPKTDVKQPTSLAPTLEVTSAAPHQNSTSTDTPTSSTPTIDMEALILEKLQNHHSIERVFGAKHTREEWNATLDRMIGYGAKISEEEKQIIIDYLLSR